MENLQDSEQFLPSSGYDALITSSDTSSSDESEAAANMPPSSNGTSADVILIQRVPDYLMGGNLINNVSAATVEDASKWLEALLLSTTPGVKLNMEQYQFLKDSIDHLKLFGNARYPTDLTPAYFPENNMNLFAMKAVMENISIERDPMGQSLPSGSRGGVLSFNVKELARFAEQSTGNLRLAESTPDQTTGSLNPTCKVGYQVTPDDNGETITVALYCFESWLEWIVCFPNDFVPCEWFIGPLTETYHPNETIAHSIMLGLARALQRQILQAMIQCRGEMASRTGKKIKPQIILTGRGVSAAVASLIWACWDKCALEEIIQKYRGPFQAFFSGLCCITFGCPGTTYPELDTYSKAYAADSWCMSIINEGDLVPRCDSLYIRELILLMAYEHGHGKGADVGRLHRPHPMLLRIPGNPLLLRRLDKNGSEEEYFDRSGQWSSRYPFATEEEASLRSLTDPKFYAQLFEINCSAMANTLAVDPFLHDMASYAAHLEVALSWCREDLTMGYTHPQTPVLNKGHFFPIEIVLPADGNPLQAKKLYLEGDFKQLCDWLISGDFASYPDKRVWTVTDDSNICPEYHDWEPVLAFYARFLSEEEGHVVQLRVDKTLMVGALDEGQSPDLDISWTDHVKYEMAKRTATPTSDTGSGSQPRTDSRASQSGTYGAPNDTTSKRRALSPRRRLLSMQKMLRRPMSPASEADSLETREIEGSGSSRFSRASKRASSAFSNNGVEDASDHRRPSSGQASSGTASAMSNHPSDNPSSTNGEAPTSRGITRIIRRVVSALSIRSDDDNHQGEDKLVPKVAFPMPGMEPASVNRGNWPRRRRARTQMQPIVEEAKGPSPAKETPHKPKGASNSITSGLSFYTDDTDEVLQDTTVEAHMPTVTLSASDQSVHRRAKSV